MEEAQSRLFEAGFSLVRNQRVWVSSAAEGEEKGCRSAKRPTYKISHEYYKAFCLGTYVSRSKAGLAGSTGERKDRAP